jgi:hypothetical protein
MPALHTFLIVLVIVDMIAAELLLSSRVRQDIRLPLAARLMFSVLPRPGTQDGLARIGEIDKI